MSDREDDLEKFNQILKTITCDPYLPWTVISIISICTKYDMHNDYLNLCLIHYQLILIWCTLPRANRLPTAGQSEI